jgi:hypothetical protein
MSTINDRTDKLFMEASLSDDDLGYPAEVAFVPADEDWADEVLWRTLIEGRPTVLVGEEIELLLTPLRRGPIDRLGGRLSRLSEAAPPSSRVILFGSAARGDRALHRMLEINAKSPIGDLMVEGLGEAEFSYCALTENLTKENFEFLFYAFAQCATERDLLDTERRLGASAPHTMSTITDRTDKLFMEDPEPAGRHPVRQMRGRQ